MRGLGWSWRWGWCVMLEAMHCSEGKQPLKDRLEP